MRLLKTAAAAVVVMAVLAGCSEGGQANETLPTASSSAATTSESLPPLGPPDLPMPAEARAQDEAAAVAALEYYVRLLSHQLNQGGQPLRDLSRECRFCTLIADRIDADVAAGNRYTGGQIALAEVNLPAIEGSVAEFAFSASQGAIQVMGPDGSPLADRGESAVSGVSGAAAMTWDRQQQAWFITQLTFG